MKHYSFLVLIALVASCGSDQPENTQPQDAVILADTTIKPSAALLNTLDATLFEVPLEISDGTLELFFNESKDFPISVEQFKALQLDSLETCEGCYYYVLGIVKLSEEFTTRLIFRNSGWNEWVMWLVNYDAANQKTDHLKVLYADSVEGLYTLASTLQDGEISVVETNFFQGGDSEMQKITQRIYILNGAGSFEKIRESNVPESGSDINVTIQN